MTPGNPFLDRDAFEDEVFSDLELPKADFSGKEFIRCTFKTLALEESGWKGARLEDCVFDGCDLNRMRPAKMSAHGIAFINCRLVGIDWTDMGPNPVVSFEACNLQYASFVKVNLTNTRFTHCKLADANFFESRLVGAEFTDSDMSATLFENCDARKANFSEARNLYIDPAKNRVKDARIALTNAVLLALSFGMRVSGFNDDESG